MIRILLPLLLIVALILGACSAAAPASDQTTPSTENDASASVDLTRSDEQGTVTVEVTPLNLDNPSEQLEFNVVMNTHAVDLSMDLATLATLTTDTGTAVQATLWEAPRGGHHVKGKLIFPATKGGKTILENASKLTLTITNVGAPSRVFEWPVP